MTTSWCWLDRLKKWDSRAVRARESLLMIWPKSTQIVPWLMYRPEKRPVVMPIAYLLEMHLLKLPKEQKDLEPSQVIPTRHHREEWTRLINWIRDQDIWRETLYRQEWGNFQWTALYWILSSKRDTTRAFIQLREPSQVGRLTGAK